jgi:hypothetical protein
VKNIPFTYQKGYNYNNEQFTWPPLSRDNLSLLNKEGVLTQKNFEYLLGWRISSNLVFVLASNHLIERRFWGHGDGSCDKAASHGCSE